MIHFVSPGGELIDRSLQSVLSCYGAQWQSHQIVELQEWELDNLIADPSTHAILSGCDPAIVKIYFDKLPITISTPAHWWQILPPSARGWEAIVPMVFAIKEKFSRLEYTFLLSDEVDGKVWTTIANKVPPQILNTIAKSGRIARLPSFDLQKLRYTYFGKVQTCLVLPRADRLTNDRVGKLLSIIVDRVPLYLLL